MFMNGLERKEVRDFFFFFNNWQEFKEREEKGADGDGCTAVLEGRREDRGAEWVSLWEGGKGGGGKG